MALRDEFEPLRDLVRRQIFASFAVRRGILVLGKPSPGGNLRVDADTMVLDDMLADLLQLMQQRGLVHHAEEGKGRTKGFVTPAVVDALHRELSELVGMDTATKLLGLSRAGVLRSGPIDFTHAA